MFVFPSPFLGASLQPRFTKLAGSRAVWSLDFIFNIPILLIYLLISVLLIYN